MQKTLKIAFAVLSALIAGRYLTSDEEIAPTPAPRAALPLTLATLELEAALQQRVSVDLNGTFEDVVKWLRSTGVSFVIADSEISKRKISIKMENQPLKDAMEAIAEAMGGRWVKKGEVYTFSQGSPFLFAPGAPAREIAPREFARVEGFAIPPQALSGEKMTPEQRAKFEKEMKNFAKGVEGFEIPPMVFSGEKMTQEQRAKFEKEVKGFKLDGKAFKELLELKDVEGKLLDLKRGDVKVWINGKEATPEQIKKLESKGNLHFFGGDMKGLDEKTVKQIEEAMKISEKQLDLHFKGMTEKQKAEMKKKFTFSDDLDLLDKAKQTEVRAKMLDAEKHLNLAKPMLDKVKTMKFENADIKSLMKSLTPAQRELHKKQGFLKSTDLNAEQRKMLPVGGSGDWSFHFSIDGDSLTIKKG